LTTQVLTAYSKQLMMAV